MTMDSPLSAAETHAIQAEFARIQSILHRALDPFAGQPDTPDLRAAKLTVLSDTLKAEGVAFRLDHSTGDLNITFKV